MKKWIHSTSCSTWRWCEIKGVDTEDFLKRLTTVQPSSLRPLTGAPGFLLTPRGKIQSAFILWQLGENHFAFELDSGKNETWIQRLQETINYYHFSESIEFTLTDLRCVWILEEEKSNSELNPPLYRIEKDKDFLFCHHPFSYYGKKWTSIWASQNELNIFTTQNKNKFYEISEHEIEELRIKHLTPRIDFEITTEVNPLELGLRSGIAENKGCYPGQEVIEKIISLGSPAKKLVLFSGKIKNQNPLPVKNEELIDKTDLQSIGVITSIVSHSNGFQGLALIKNSFLKKNKSNNISSAQLMTQNSKSSLHIDKVCND